MTASNLTNNSHPSTAAENSPVNDAPSNVMRKSKEIDDHDDSDGVDSADEALMEMLGLPSLDAVVDEVEEAENVNDGGRSSLNAQNNSPLRNWTDEELSRLVEQHQLKTQYETESICVFPSECSIPAEYMRRLTDELVWGGNHVQADRSYETVQVYKQGTILPKKSLTRLEHFVDAHEKWSDLCHNYLRKLVSKALGVEMVLYKEKLNLKPPGGSGFAPHLDTPSLRIAMGAQGPQTFCTVMVAIDDMTLSNGCLRVCKGPWSEDHCIETIAPDLQGNPDAGGRAGAISPNDADALYFEPIVCKGGTIAVFNGWAPHRSAANGSPFPRRAVFLTYNPKEEGDFHQRYYDMMDEKRRQWRESVGLASSRQDDERLELEALSTIPKI